MEFFEYPAEQSWPFRSALGNHRILIETDAPAEVAEIRASWRLRDKEPQRLGMRLVCLDTGEEIFDILPLEVTHVGLCVRFRAPVAGKYALYWLPLKLNDKAFVLEDTSYMLASEMKPDSEWLLRAKNTAAPARVLRFEGRNAFECFTPMEMPALPEELQALSAAYPDRPFLLFPADRTRPAMMRTELPVCLCNAGPSDMLITTVRPGENCAFQILVYASTDLHDLSFSSDLAAVQCINTCGIDCLGQPFTGSLQVKAGQVCILWIFLPNVAETTSFTASVTCAEGKSSVSVTVLAEGEAAVNGNVDAPQLFTRLNWLNSSRGIDSEAFAGLPAVRWENGHFFCEGREVAFSDSGLPSSIVSRFSDDLTRTDAPAMELLSSPMSFRFDVNGIPAELRGKGTRCEQPGSGLCVVSAGAEFAGGHMECVTRSECDGHLDTLITLTAEQDLPLDNIRLILPMQPETALYAVGFGLEGGKAPARHDYRWNIEYANNMFWLGNHRGGLCVKFKHTEDVWEIYNYRKEGLPESWYADGRGHITLDNGCITAFAGSRLLKKGERFCWRFALNLTPLRRRDMAKHWAQRYYHIDTWAEPVPNLDKAYAGGATVVNLHQGGDLNAYINYPFLKQEELRAQIDRAHELGMKYKLYYTVREISNHVCELPVLVALGDEVLRYGPGFKLADHFSSEGNGIAFCGPWLREHLYKDFVPAWQQRLADGDFDSAVATQGLSRWHNYYIEGLHYLTAVDGIDGIYLDGVGYDREIMKRVRKTMDCARPGCLIDYHSGNNFNPIYGLVNPIAQYLELLPCVDRLWIGEGYDFENTSPEYWLVEMTGIPFGLTGEMLGPGGGNPWRGMVFGMSCRMGWQQGGDPTALWKAWDDIGLTGSNMKGWWEPDCGIRTGRDLVKATLFENGSKRFIAVASWEKEEVSVTLGCSFPVSGYHTSAIAGFQSESAFAAGEPIRLPAGKGLLLEVL